MGGDLSRGPRSLFPCNGRSTAGHPAGTHINIGADTGAGWPARPEAKLWWVEPGAARASRTGLELCLAAKRHLFLSVQLPVSDALQYHTQAYDSVQTNAP